MSTFTNPGSAGNPAAEPKAEPTRDHRKHRVMLMSGGALFLIALVAGFVPQFRQRQTAAGDTKELAIPTVAVVSPTVTTPHSGLNLPAEVKPWQEASIFARVNGYLKDWLVDIGAHVQKDQLLAEIDTPDLDQQLAQAQSQAVLAKRNLEQAKKTNTKWQELYKQGVVSQLDAENTDSRPMLVALQVENSKNEILPGSYATVRVPEVALGKLVTLPDNTLIFRGKSVQVGIVDAKGVVQLRDVKVGRDFGVQSEILSGVSESDKVIVNPSDSLTTGTTVRLAATLAASPSPGVPKK